MSFWINNQVMITGGGGFLGTHVVEALAERGVTDPAVIRSKNYDLTLETDVKRLFADHQPDIVIHLAGLVGGILPNQERPAEFFYRNLMMGTLLLHHASQSGVRKFIAAGAGCGYPEGAANPLKEDDFWAGFPQAESAPYSLAKRLLSIQGEAYFRQFGFPSIIGIPGNIYGPHDNFHLPDAHVIPALVRKFVEAVDRNDPSVEVWGTGRAARDFVYARDVAEGLLDCAEHYQEYTLVNLSSGVETSVKEIVTCLRKISGFDGEIEWNHARPDGQLYRRFDVSKAQTDLNWSARTPLTNGLRLTFDWYCKHQHEARR